MKTLLTKLLAICSIGLLMLPACKKDEKKVYATNVATSGLQASSTTLILTKADLTKTAVTFNITQADFGYSAAITNVLQIDAPNDNFAHPKEFTISGKSATQAFTTQDFNNLVLALNLPTGVASPVQARIKSSISATVDPVYSNVLSLTVTPFALISYVWVPGEYQNSDGSKQWSPPTADSLVSPTGNGVYNGYVYFSKANSSFKVTSNPDWNHTNYGKGTIDGTLSSTGDNLTSPATPGLYKVTVDLNANTITYVAYNHGWSIIGFGDIDWNTDIDMPFVQNSNVYQAITTLKSSGAIKFRADHDWGINLGDASPVDGTLVANGGNIAIPSNGTYVVSLSFGNPLLGPTYTLVKQ